MFRLGSGSAVGDGRAGCVFVFFDEEVGGERVGYLRAVGLAVAEIWEAVFVAAFEGEEPMFAFGVILNGELERGGVKMVMF